MSSSMKSPQPPTVGGGGGEGDVDGGGGGGEREKMDTVCTIIWARSLEKLKYFKQCTLSLSGSLFYRDLFL